MLSKPKIISYSLGLIFGLALAKRSGGSIADFTEVCSEDSVLTTNLSNPRTVSETQR
ncbi:MAG: hypothetical protein GDA48_26875 [Hormoscilla sp. GM102CHS1]|nr:hypothetical protein [Hormoscilla sp. GM102CHS1]